MTIGSGFWATVPEVRLLSWTNFFPETPPPHFFIFQILFRLRPRRWAEPPPLSNPHLVPKVLEKSRAVSLLTLMACVAYNKGENLPIPSSR